MTTQTFKGKIPSVAIWAERQAIAFLNRMEMQKIAESLTLQWPSIKKGFISGYKSGAEVGFKLGYETAIKMVEKTLPPEDATLEPDPNQTELELNK